MWYHLLMERKKNIAASTPEMVTISRTEYESQQAELTELKLQNQWLLEQLGLAKKRQFGVSSERLQEGLMDQLSLMANEAEAYAYGTKNATAEQVAVKAHARKRQSGNVLDIVPEGTPTEVVEHRLSEEERICDVCGAVMEEIGKEVRRSLKMEPARFWIQEDVYYTYACKQCEAETGEGNLRKTPRQPTLCPGSFASPEAVAHIMTQKYVMYSPLYRLEQEFQRQGLKLSRQTMANWILQASDTWLRPVYDALHRKLCQETVLHGDETTLQVLKEPGGRLRANPICGSTGPAAALSIPLSCMSTGPAGRRSTPRHSSRISPAGCTRTATRATTSCPRTSGLLAAGPMPGENLTKRCRRCPKRNGRILWRQPASVTAPGCFSWSSLSWN